MRERERVILKCINNSDILKIKDKKNSYNIPSDNGYYVVDVEWDPISGYYGIGNILENNTNSNNLFSGSLNYVRFVNESDTNDMRINDKTNIIQYSNSTYSDSKSDIKFYLGKLVAAATPDRYFHNVNMYYYAGVRPTLVYKE